MIFPDQKGEVFFSILTVGFPATRDRKRWKSILDMKRGALPSDTHKKIAAGNLHSIEIREMCGVRGQLRMKESDIKQNVKYEAPDDMIQPTYFCV